MATKISKIKDELNIHLTFEEKASWNLLKEMSFQEAKSTFHLWFASDREAQRKLENAGKIILVNDFNGDACIKAHPDYKAAKSTNTGNCASIW
ncbi:hypothetical protein DRN34_02215 [Thermococci archaeon]|nr:MAG: hypothetical protein DRN34_02215 [Thermococci archaeon]